MNSFHLKIICAVVFTVVIFAVPATAQLPTQKPPQAEQPDESSRIFDIKVPKGFELQPQDEQGIIKWRKDGAEIYVVVGDLFLESGEKLFQELFKAASENKNFENVQKVSVKNGYGFVYTEKAPGEPDRLRATHMIVITDKKVLQVDFSAPEKDFPSFTADFDAARKSFKLRNSVSK